MGAGLNVDLFREKLIKRSVNHLWYQSVSNVVQTDVMLSEMSQSQVHTLSGDCTDSILSGSGW